MKKIELISEIALELPKSLSQPADEEIRELLLPGNIKQVISFFDNMPEEQRGRFADYCLEACKYFEKKHFNEPMDIKNLGDGHVRATSGMKRHLLWEIWDCAKAAVLATASWSKIEKLNQFYNKPTAEAILRSRRPSWTKQFWEYVAEQSDLHFHSDEIWEAYRRFVHEKICETSSANSISELMFAFFSGSPYRQDLRKHGTKPISALLQEDPTLIDNELWNLFEITAFRRNWSYTTQDRHHHWHHAFCDLIAQGMISVDRVIDGCFRALERPFTDHQLKWFVDLLEKIVLENNVSDEILLKETRFIDLLDHVHATPRALGLKIIERLLKAKRVDAVVVLPRLRGVFREPVKAKVKKALTLLDMIAKEYVPLRNDVCRVAMEGLLHELPEIQQATVDLLLKLDAFHDPELYAELQKIVPSLSASVRKNLPKVTFDAESIAQKNTPQTPTPNKVTSTSGTKHSVIREKLEPVQSFDELLDLATRMIESAYNPDEVERLLDGLLRWGHAKPDDFDKKAAPLLKQAYRLLGNNRDYPEDGQFFLLEMMLPYRGFSVVSDCIFVLLAWLCGLMPEYSPHPQNAKKRLLTLGKKSWTIWSGVSDPKNKTAPFLLFSAIAHSVAEQVIAGKPSSLLCTPTHRGGWIDPFVFAERLIEAYRSGTLHSEHERVLSLLRLDFSGREKAITMIEKSIPKKDEYIDAVRYALGANGVKIGKTPHYWIAAARCRAPLGDDMKIEKTFPGHGPDAGEAAHYVLKKRKHVGIALECLPIMTCKNIDLSLFPTVALHDPIKADYMDFRQEHPWKLLVWPQNLDPAIGAAITPHSLDTSVTYETGFQPFIEVMQCSDVPIHTIGAVAVFTGMAMKCQSLYMAATDTMIVAISENRLAAETAIEAALELLPLKTLIFVRWLKPLKIIAEQSELHAYVVHDILEGIVPKLDMKVVGGFLELLYELCVTENSPIRTQECRTYLETIKGSGKAAKLAKKLLELK